MPANHHLAYQPRSASTITVQVGGTRPRKACNKASHSGFHGCLRPAGKTFQRIGTAQPRYTTLMTSRTKRCPKVVASKATASCVPDQPSKTPFSHGAQHGPRSSSTRCRPAFASASRSVSRRRSRTVWNGWPSRHDHPSAIAVKLHERTTIIPKLHKAKPMTIGWLRWGKCLAISVRH